MNDRDHKFLEAYGKEKLYAFSQELIGLLDGMANACRVLRSLIEILKQTNETLFKASANNPSRMVFYEEWLEVSTKHQEMCALLGFATLLRMDASYMMIQLLNAESETEKIIACKHSYTIVAEARNNDLFKEISAKMRLYPETIFSREEYNDLWKENKVILKGMTNDSIANKIRNHIDSHKSSFVYQMDAYASIDYAQCLLDMMILILVTQNVDASLRQINRRIGNLINVFEMEERKYMVQLKALLKQIS